MLKDLQTLFAALREREDVRILVLGAEGKVFSAGADLTEMVDISGKTDIELQEEAGLFFDCFDTLYKLPIPSICYVQGTVRGGANGLVAACDFTYAEKNTSFSFGEVGLGLIPATVAPFVLRRCGMMNARKMMLGGETFDAENALNYGLIDYLSEEKGPGELVEEQIKALQKNGPEAMRKTKKLLLEIDQYHDSASLKKFCTSLIAETRLSDEASEGISAFFEKRDPRWK